MGKYEKLRQAILSGNRDDNLDFNDILWFVEKSGYERKHNKTSGSHQIFVNKETKQMLNLQEKNGKAKAYQIKQLRKQIKEEDGYEE